MGRKCCQREASSAALCRRCGFLRQLVQSEVAFSFILTFLSHTPSILLPRVHVMLLLLFILSLPLAIFLPVCVEGFILSGILESEVAVSFFGLSLPTLHRSSYFVSVYCCLFFMPSLPFAINPLVCAYGVLEGFRSAFTDASSSHQLPPQAEQMINLVIMSFFKFKVQMQCQITTWAIKQPQLPTTSTKALLNVCSVAEMFDVIVILSGFRITHRGL